jgi:hypothetical protein
MTPLTNNATDLYHYTENGQTKGPVTAQQLKALADSGRIQANTYVWKEGLPDWVPAASLQGLLPQAQGIIAQNRVPSQAQARPATILEAGAGAAPQTQVKLLVGVIIGGVLLLSAIVAGVIILIVNSSTPEKKGKGEPADKVAKNTDDSKKKDPPVKQPDPPKKKEPPPPPPTPPPEFTLLDLLTKYKNDPVNSLQELGGKRLTLKVQGTWEVRALEDAIRDGKLILWYGRNARDTRFVHPHQDVQLIFPLGDEKAKLGFFAKVEGYAKQLKKGEQVVMSVTGVLTSLSHNNQTFLLIKDATMN